MSLKAARQDCTRGLPWTAPATSPAPAQEKKLLQRTVALIPRCCYFATHDSLLSSCTGTHLLKPALLLLALVLLLLQATTTPRAAPTQAPTSSAVPPPAEVPDAAGEMQDHTLYGPGKGGTEHRGAVRDAARGSC